MISGLAAGVAALEAELRDLRALGRRIVSERVGRVVPDTIIVGIDSMGEV